MAGRGRSAWEHLSQLEWWRTEVAPRLPVQIDQDALAAATAHAIRESEVLRGRPLGSLLEGLKELPHTPSYWTATRAYRILRSCSDDTWGDLAQRSVLDLNAWPDCGERTVAEILAVAVDQWFSASWPDTPDPPSPPEDLPSQARVRSSTDWQRDARWEAGFRLELLCRAAYPHGAENIGEAVALAIDPTADDEAPPDWLAHVWRRLASIEIAELIRVERRLEDAWASLLVFTERDLRILEARCPTHPARIPLSALGRELGVTPERVRQIDRNRRGTIAARLEDGDCVVIMHHARRMRRTLGTFVPDAAIEAALQPLLPSDAPHPVLCRDIVLGHAGPYRFESGFWQVGNPLLQMKVAVAERPSESWTVEDLDRLMDGAGVAVEHRETCRAALSIGVDEIATPTQMRR